MVQKMVKMVKNGKMPKNGKWARGAKMVKLATNGQRQGIAVNRAIALKV